MQFKAHRNRWPKRPKNTLMSRVAPVEMTLGGDPNQGSHRSWKTLHVSTFPPHDYDGWHGLDENSEPWLARQTVHHFAGLNWQQSSRPDSATKPFPADLCPSIERSLLKAMNFRSLRCTDKKFILNLGRARSQSGSLGREKARSRLLPFSHVLQTVLLELLEFEFMPLGGEGVLLVAVLSVCWPSPSTKS